MTTSVPVVCPSCGAKLTISKPSLFGKRVACPACRKPFLIAAPLPDAQPTRDRDVASNSKRDAVKSPASKGRAGGESPAHRSAADRPGAGPSAAAAHRTKGATGRSAPGETEPYSDNFNLDDDFDVHIDESVLQDEDEGPAAPALRRKARSQSKKPRPASANKRPLLIGALVGGSILAGFALYSRLGSRDVQRPPAALVDAKSAAAEETGSTAGQTAADAETTNAAPRAASPGKSSGGAAKPVTNKKDAAPPAGKSVVVATLASPDNRVGGLVPAAAKQSKAPMTFSAPASRAQASVSPDAVPRSAPAKDLGDGSIVGRAIPAFAATAIDDTRFQLASCKEQVLVVAFMGVDCPLANLYYPRLAQMAAKYRGKSVGMIAVDSNAQDTLEAIRKQARSNRVSFPVLKDGANEVAALFGAQRTPEVFVLDAKRLVRYHGMIDDQYGYGKRRGQPTKNYVIDAVEALLASQVVPVPQTEVQGCRIGRMTKPAAAATTSFYRDVLPILQNRCQHCHRKGEIGPFALKDYEVVREWGPTIREAVLARRMPPWPADPHVGQFSNDASLSDAEMASICKWVDEGCPAGNPAEKPPEKKFVEGWNIGKPDRVFKMPHPYRVPATGVVQYQNFFVSDVFTQDLWVQAVECRFGNRSVVHHMLVLLDFPKDHSKSQDGLAKGFFAAGAPGATYFSFPKGYAKRIPKGARLRFQMHYTPNGTPAEDESRFGLVLAKGSRFQEIQTYALGKPDIRIPAGAADHAESSTQTIPGDIILTTLMPHLHLRGKSFTYTAVWPDGKTQTLLSVPRWDFNWQPPYQLAKPIRLPKNSKIIVEAHWDNSADNPNNILPPVDVSFGEQTFDEMFIGYVNYVPMRSMADTTRSRGSRRRG